MFKRILLPYSVGLGKIYSEDDISKMKLSPSWDREMNLAYLGEAGNCFNEEDIQACVKMGETVDVYNPYTSENGDVTMGIDPGFSGGTSGVGSRYGIVIIQVYNQRLEVVFAEGIPTSRPTRMVEVIRELRAQYGVRNVYVDSSNPGIVADIKEIFGDDYTKENWERQLSECKKLGIHPINYMNVVPVSFSKENSAAMLTHAQKVITNHAIAIPVQFNDLIVELRIAKAIENRLDKSVHSLDILDSLRLGLLHFMPRTK